MKLLLIFFFINIFFSPLFASTRCKDSMKPFIQFLTEHQNIQIPKSIFKFMEFPKFDLEENETTNKLFPNAKQNINTIEMEAGHMGKLTVYHDNKTKENILLKIYDNKKEMNEDIERLNILNQLITVSKFKNLKAVKYIPLIGIKKKMYSKFFYFSKEKDMSSTVISYNFINRENLFYSTAYLSIKEIKLTKSYIKQTFINFINTLNSSKEIHKQTPYKNFRLELIIDGNMLYPRISFINSKTKKEYLLVPHSKNLIIGDDGTLNIVDPF